MKEINKTDILSNAVYVENIEIAVFDDAADADHFIHMAQDLYDSKLFLEIE